MNLSNLAKSVANLKKTFMNPDGIECLYIDKDGKKHNIDVVDACFWGTQDKSRLSILFYEERPDESKDLPL
jgi:hypothetical protein